ncbi:MAG: peptidoglycan DD-metalloendopeptidase family protein [Bdellovibrionales bacterium]
MRSLSGNTTGRPRPADGNRFFAEQLRAQSAPAKSAPAIWVMQAQPGYAPAARKTGAAFVPRSASASSSSAQQKPRPSAARAPRPYGVFTVPNAARVGASLPRPVPAASPQQKRIRINPQQVRLAASASQAPRRVVQPVVQPRSSFRPRRRSRLTQGHKFGVAAVVCAAVLAGVAVFANIFDGVGDSLQHTASASPVTSTVMPEDLGNDTLVRPDYVDPRYNGSVRPVAGAFMSDYSSSHRPDHAGFDYDGVIGDPINVTDNGCVVAMGPRGGYGNAIEVRHNGFTVDPVTGRCEIDPNFTGPVISTLYGHTSAYAENLAIGSFVHIGQKIAEVGNSGDVDPGQGADGSHLHYEIRINGVPVRPIWANMGQHIPLRPIEQLVRMHPGADVPSFAERPQLIAARAYAGLSRS